MKKNSATWLIIVVAIAVAGPFAAAEPSPEDQEKFPVLKEAFREQSKGNCRTAIKLYTHAYKNNTARSSVVPSIYSCYFDLGQKDDGLNFIKKAAKENPFDQDIRLFLADKLHEMGHDESALKELAYVEKLQAQDFRASLKRGMILKKQGRHDVAVISFNHYIDKAKPTTHQPYLHRAESLQSLGQNEAALKDIKKAYDIKPFDENVLATHTTILRDLKKFSEAEPFAKQCSEVSPKSVNCWDLRGDMAIAVGKRKDAVDYYGSAVRLAQDNFTIRTKLAEAYMANDQYKESDAEFNRVFKVKPDHLPAMQSWLPSLMKRQNYNLASTALRDFNEAAPKVLWGALEYANLMNFVGSTDIAVQVMRNSVRATRHDLARFYSGYYEFKFEKHSRSIDVLEDIKDAKLGAAFHIGLVHFGNQKFEKALRVWDKIKSEDPFYARAQLNSVLAMERMGKVTEAADRLAGFQAPDTVRGYVTKLQSYLEALKSRTPADAKDQEGNGLPEDVQSLLQWELPK